MAPGSFVCHPSVPAILERFGKRYIWQPVPEGLPRYRTIGNCHANAQRAVLNDERLTYVEGVALSRSIGTWFGHAWVTLDGVHAIDLTWRGQSVRWSARNREAQARFGKPPLTDTMDPAAEYVGVEIPREELAALIVANKAHMLLLDQWAARKAA
jgi:hypothetical protein